MINMGPYYFHIRFRLLLYIAGVTSILYLWYSVLSSEGNRLKVYRTNYVNFKHLLIACIVAAQRGGLEVKMAKNSNLDLKIKGKTREGVLDVLTAGDKRSNVAMVNSLLYTFPGIRIVSEEHLPATSDVQPIVVTEALLKSDQFSTIPDDIVLNLDDLVIWIDPLDATKEYSEGLTQYVTTMVCVARRGEPFIGVIHQPFASKTYWASKFGIDKQLLALRRSFASSRDPIRVVISRSHNGDLQQSLLHRLPMSDIAANITVTQAAGSGYKTLELLKGHADIYLHKTYIKKWDICAPNALLRYATEGTLSMLASDESIDYDFDSDFVIRDGVFATAKRDLVSRRSQFASSI